MNLTTTLPEIRPVFDRPELLDEEYRFQLAHIKRFLERHESDPEFRRMVREQPDDVQSRYGVHYHPDEIRPIWDRSDRTPAHEVSLPVRRYRNWVTEKHLWREHIRKLATPQNPTFAAWRQRQMNRCQGELGPTRAVGLVHAPVCIELARGCSVGCWFCGVAAPKLEDVFQLEPGRELWRGTLQALGEVLGRSSAGQGFCYWASDPMDNPDYLGCLQEFHGLLGHWPQTTTALPLRDPARLRGILEAARSHGGKLDRFSVLTLGIFEKIYAEYTAEELLFVELVPQNKESTAPKARAGRALEKGLKTEPRAAEAPDNSTIACVSGFLINMVERSVRLITPCNADERWPLGYRIYGQATFADGPSLKALLQQMVAGLKTCLSAGDRPQLRRGVHLQAEGDTLRAVSPLTTQVLRKSFPWEALKAGIEAGNSVIDLALKLESQGVELTQTMHELNELFRLGVLDDEPAH